MSSDDQPSVEEFRARAVEFLNANAQALSELDEKQPVRLHSVADAKAFHAGLVAAGLGGITYPVQYGGLGLREC